jgi:radical SAM protein with 4Fe4S-binding SPASM domain
MCGQWGDTGIYRGGEAEVSAGGERERIKELIGRHRQLGLADYVKLLDELQPHRPVISLFGGEPFLHPDIVPLIREIKARELTLTIITNGWHLESHAEVLAEAGVDTIAVSVDGPPELHDKIRGTPGSFARLAAGVRAVDRERRRRRRAAPVMMAILPVTEHNTGEVGPALEALYGLPLDMVNVGLRWFVPEEAGAKYEQVMRERFSVESASSWRGFDFSWKGGQDAPDLKGLVKDLKAVRRRRLGAWLRGGPWTTFVPAVEPDEVPGYFTDFDKTFGHDLCPVAWYFAQVEPDGDVCFCGDFPDYSIGNVRQQPFQEIWTGERARAFREELARRPLPICNRCCGSFVYGKWARPGLPATAPRDVPRLSQPNEA